ncbi:MAG TPA: DPP IV N-terminal domain-containing protein, partial [Pyrinomonadaceae bacterium]|nr:DPP IV N-terminal domain-containing protein [Pyrinomonadaceae bacterium]
MRTRLTIFSLVLILLSVSAAALAQDRLLTVDDIYDPVKRVNFNGTPPNPRWLKDGKYYLVAGDPKKPDQPRLLKVNALTGDSSAFFDASKMEAALAALPGMSRDDARRLSNRTNYQLNPAQTGALLNHANDLFYYEFGSASAWRLTNSPDEEVGETFSPDGRMVSYVRGNNIYIVDLAAQKERALTSDGSPKILNGRLDWVYQEELYGRGNFEAYWWSPDSTQIAYLRLDENPVHEFTVVDHIPVRQELEVTPYPKAGDPNPLVQLGVVNASGGATRWVDTYKYQPADLLVVRVGWTPDSRRVVYQAQNREQTFLDLNYANAADGKTTNVIHEASKAWVEATDDNPRYLKDGSFLWLSDKSGRRHIYHHAADGKVIRQVTDGSWDVRSVEGVDEAKGLIYFTASEHSPIAANAYSVKLDGSALTRLTQTEGAHRADFNSTFTHFVDYWSDVNTPTQVRLFDANGKLARVIDENKVAALSQFKLGKSEFVQVKTRDGFTMEAQIIRPPDFDPSKKYPVMEFTYSGPQAPQVRNGWGGAAYMWHQMLAQKGYIVWICDNRTASNKGVESAWPAFHNFGELELRDLEDGLAWLKTQPYVDGSRIGIWGWSYGGFMTSYALTHSQSFKMGIAGGSVTDWRNYDSIYTERYMGTPQNNPEGYRRTAPLAAAKDLHGKLLLIHGAMDDNVHVQNTIQFAYELQKAGKPFQLMLYPKSR